jgi:asparagine synthase (glutamine-hydrolysing)
MCGISGFYQTLGQPIEQSKLQLMLATQHHRGPDAEGTYYNQHIGLAHNRLSLLDLSENGNQPFKDSENVLIYNGEIYNYLELKKELPFQHWKSGTDTEVLFHALKHWGVESTLKKIKGMFAFAWYDIKSNELYLGRDRYGIKPLFYGFDNAGTYWFASEQKAILKVADFQPDSVKMLFSTVGILEKSDSYTVWKNMFIVPGGHYIVINEKGASVKEYYNLSDAVQETEYRRLEKAGWGDVIQEFDDIMSRSVKGMLMADAPMGAYVSGGIDSSLIAAYATPHVDSFKFFTANVLGNISEFEDAKRLSSFLKKDLYDYPFEKKMALRDWVKVTWHYESPIVVHFNAIPMSNVSGLAREHGVKAVLTGEGSDELFLGYPRLLTKKYDGLIKGPYTFLNRLYSLIPGLKSYTNASEGSLGIMGLFEQGVQGFQRQIKRNQQIGAYAFVPGEKQADHYLSSQMLQEGIRALLWRNDRMGMIYSIEARFPFLDEEVVHFSLNLPLKYKIGRTNQFYNFKHPFLMDKAIVRKTSKKYLPKDLYQKKKNGFPTYGLRFMKVKPEFFYDGVSASLLGLGKTQIDYMCNSFNTYHIAILASFELWAKLFIQHQSFETTQAQVDQYVSL